MRFPIKAARQFFDTLTLTEREMAIARRVLKEIRERLGFLSQVGLDYLTLDRPAATLSGGEGQRIRLATQIGSSLVGVLYILDEPSIGLHQRDNGRLLDTLKRLRDLGNTVLVVEHDEETMRAADYVVDLGPGAGELGGHLVAVGTPDEVMANPDSLTGRFLAGRGAHRPHPRSRRKSNGKFVTIHNPREHNLKGMNVQIPLGTFTAVTGVSGSGKSTLVNDILYRALASMLHRAQDRPGAHDRIEGAQHLDKVIDIDQSPIGRTPRSNPATYTGRLHAHPHPARADARRAHARLPAGTLLVQRQGRALRGLPGRRAGEDRDALPARRVRDLRGLPRQALQPRDARGALQGQEHRRRPGHDGGGGARVLRAGARRSSRSSRPCTTWGSTTSAWASPPPRSSGGEAQRVKLATELSRRATGRTLYILDEPTTGLHFADIRRLLEVLNQLVDQGNTVVIIEHNMDVIKTADWIVDLGPEGGNEGGKVIAAGTPEEVARQDKSFTGQYLSRALKAG